MSKYLLAYYGDDSTGSTDVMEALTINGVKTVLFMEVPTQDQLRQFPDVQAVGIAGTSRSMTPDQMKDALPPLFRALEALNADFLHYKICSTFDSSPSIGSIGYAIGLALESFERKPFLIPLMIGVPVLLRYVVFGNLFATVQGVTHRLDRHPTMSVHPATPMNEADLRLHLAKQTNLPIRHLSVHDLTQSPEYLVQQLLSIEQEQDGKPTIILVDTLTTQDIRTLGQLLLSYRPTQSSFVVGSSGVEYALVDAWQASGKVQAPSTSFRVSPIDQLLVMSGSASPVTNRQIETIQTRANAQLVAIDTERLIDPAQYEDERKRLVEKGLSILRSGQSLILHTAQGADDPRLAATRQRMSELNLDTSQTAAILGHQQGLILNALIDLSRIKRLCVVGGDTSGHVAHTMGITALGFVASVAPGAPLCLATSTIAANNGLEIAFKGGQNGKEDYFLKLLNGS